MSLFDKRNALFNLFLKVSDGTSVLPGISGKSQILFAIVFTTRYLDLLSAFISLYNTCMKVSLQSTSGSPSWTQFLLTAWSKDLLFNQVIYIGCACATVYMIYVKFRATYDGNHDSFRVEFLVVPVGGLAVLINHDFSFLEVSSGSCRIFTRI